MDGTNPLVIPCEDCKQPEHCATRKHGCFAESARSITMGTVPGGTRLTSRVHVDPKPPRQPVENNWTRGEERQGGGFMPYIGRDGDAMKVVEYRERRQEIKEVRHRHRNDPNVFRKER